MYSLALYVEAVVTIVIVNENTYLILIVTSYLIILDLDLNLYHVMELYSKVE